jgi:4-phospho-D-threonate 3-dehydrogenase / 4-phospho-D-erythronate 3-dehydrogenase
VIGDPAGIGPEICMKALATGEPQQFADMLLLGNLDALEHAAQVCGIDTRFVVVTEPAHARGVRDAIAVLDDGRLKPSDYTLGQASAAAGMATWERIKDVVRYSQAGALDGMIVAPIDRASWKLAGITGVTDEMHPPGTYLLRATGKLRTMPIGEHVLMREVPAMVTRENVRAALLFLGDQLKRWGFDPPKIGVAGLNPHCAGEEDRDEIAPAIADAREAGIDAIGPISPDAIFRQGLAGRYDAILTMYHDQGQIAVKTVGLESAATIFVGLPYVRVGVPHGSAFDIAGTGTAQHTTMLTAMTTAASLASGRGIA